MLQFLLLCIDMYDCRLLRCIGMNFGYDWSGGVSTHPATNRHVESQKPEHVRLTRTYSYTRPAKPRYSGDRSSKELTATPPHARVSRSMFRLFARRSARIPAFDSMSSENGSMPCKRH